MVDMPHMQWDEGGRWTGAMIRAGKLPPPMPRYDNEEDEMITVKSIEQMDDAAALALANKLQTVLGRQSQSGAVGRELEEAVAAGITDGSEPRKFCTRAQAAVMIKRAVKGE